MDIFFSILVPAFKKPFLYECIDSVLKQTYRSFELIIVNDASPEDLESVVSQFSDDRIHYYVNEINFGSVDVVKNWNKCLEYASGDYVICMGDDDRLKPDCLEIYKSLIMQNPSIGLLHGWTEIIDENTETIALTAHRCERESAMSLLWHRVFAYKSQFIGDFCFNAEQLRANGGFYYFPLAWGSDEVSAIIAAKTSGVVNTQEVVFQYRKNRQTITSSVNALQKIQAINLVEDWMNVFLSVPCEDEKDELYRLELVKAIPHYYQKKKGVLVISDFRHKSRLHIFYWLRNRKALKLQAKTIYYSLIRSFF